MPGAFRHQIVTEWSDDDGVFVARVPALGPGCIAHGKTKGQAAKEARMAASLLLQESRDQLVGSRGGAGPRRS